MQLVKCHIENFGRLDNFDFDFNAGWNCLQKENGWGKTTFATFIKAMFYGLPSTTKRKVDENERKKYAPWQGGNFGGNLVFAINGKSYKIERFFGKNAAEDSFALFDLTTGKKTNDYTANLGEEVFGLDEAAFERSVYIPQKDLDGNLNESMVQKLTNLIQGTNEDFNYDSACASLDKRRAELSNNKKTGQVQNVASQIEDLTAQIHELANSGQTAAILQKQVDEKDVVIDQLVQQQNQIKAQINQYGALQDQRANQAMLDKLNRQVAATQSAVQAKQAVLNGQALGDVERTALVGDYAAQRYQALNDYFGGQVPSQETMQAVYEDTLRLHTLKNPNAVGVVGGMAVHSRKPRWLSLGLLVLALVGVLGGVFALRVQTMLAVVLFIVGGGALLGAGYLSLVNLINVKTSVSQKVDSAPNANDQAELQRLQQGVVAFLNQYENPHGDELAAVNHVLANWREYGQVRNQMELDLQTLNHRLAVEQNELAQFKAAKHFDAAAAVDDVDIDELQRRERELQRQIDVERDAKAQLIARINKIHDDMAVLDDLENQKVSLQAEKQVLEQELSAVKHALVFLAAANQSLSTKFLAPMKNGLRKYLALIANRQFDNLNLDTDFNITFEEFGQLREVDYYSQGYQNMVDLCMRLALIDTLFDGEKPFIVLDDPFVNLDDAKVEKAKQFLQKLAADHQLIYFACHKSRC